MTQDLHLADEIRAHINSLRNAYIGLQHITALLMDAADTDSQPEIHLDQGSHMGLIYAAQGLIEHIERTTEELNDALAHIHATESEAAA